MDTNIDIKMMSVLRIVRLMRLVRLLRLLRIFKELWLLVNGFIEALRVLTWIFVLLGMIIYCSAILTTLSIGDSCEEEFPHFASCDEMFGGVFKSMYTLFQVLTLESWSMAVVRPVMKTFPIAVPFFIAFLFLTSFGLMNIVVGVIVENTLQAAAQNEEKINKRRANEAQKNLEALREIFEEADEDGSGTVDKEEFRNIIKKPEVEAQFRQLELPTSEAEELFDILDEDKTGELDIKTFVEGAFKLKGAAKAKYLMGVVVSTRSVARWVDKIE
jgi:nitrogen fixation protein FixH